MNQHFKRGGQANGSSVDKAWRGATRPAVVVPIVFWVGFAVAMSISSCGKPRSHQETQTEPEAGVQTETPKPETEAQETESVSPVSAPDGDLPLEPSTATSVSQAGPAARRLTDVNSPTPVQGGYINSPTPVQEEQSHDFSHQLNSETVTFEAVNPTTKVPGRMTATITGTFSGDRLGDEDGQSPDGSHLLANQEATFSFVPYDRYSPSYSGTLKSQMNRDTTNNSIFFDFGLTATGSDGSSQQFTLREVVTVTEDGAQVTFEQLK